MHKKYTKKICDKCGKPYMPASGRQKYCKRKACVAARKKGTPGRPKLRKNAIGSKKCKNCGKMFKKKTRKQEFCTTKCVREYDHGGGRPKIVLTDEQLEKLESAFRMDCGIGEACLYAEISYSVYHGYIKDDPEFSKKVALWRQQPFLRARASMMKGIDADPNMALKYMERKKRDEFSMKTEQVISNPDGSPIDMNMNVVFVKPGDVKPDDDEEGEEEEKKD